MKLAITLQSQVDEKWHLARQMRPEHFADERSGFVGRGALELVVGNNRDRDR